MGDTMILVCGASGLTGGLLVRELRALGAPVRALVHDPKKARPLEELGVEIAVGDLARPDTLTTALHGVERVYLVSAIHPNQAKLQGNLIQAAQRAGVKHLVRLSCWNAVPDSQIELPRLHWQTDQQLEKSGLPYTILQPSYFMQNLLAFAPGIARNCTLYAPLKLGQVGMIDVRDVVAVAARLLLEPLGHTGKTYQLTGPAALTFMQVAKVLSQVTGRTVTYINIPAKDLSSLLFGQGMDPWQVEQTIDSYESLSQDYCRLVTPTVADLLGRPPRCFEQFVRKYARIFTG